MADVHSAMVKPLSGIAQTLGGQPNSETISGGNAGSNTLGNEQICHVRAEGDVYVRLGGSDTVAASASNGYRMGDGDVLDLHGSPGDKLRVDNVS